MRLNQFLAQYFNITRRQADDLIKKNHIKKNGNIGQVFDRVEIGDIIEGLQKDEWVILPGFRSNQIVFVYKPIFCLVARFDEQRRTIYDIIPRTLQALKPTSKLDYMSEGLVVMSNNEEDLYGQRHGRQGTSRTYLVGLQQEFSQKDIQAMAQGLRLGDFDLNPIHAEVFSGFDEHSYLKLQSNLKWYILETIENETTQIRRICEFFGLTVQRIIRIQDGQYHISQKLWEQKWLEQN